MKLRCLLHNKRVFVSDTGRMTHRDSLAECDGGEMATIGQALWHRWEIAGITDGMGDEFRNWDRQWRLSQGQ